MQLPACSSLTTKTVIIAIVGFQVRIVTNTHADLASPVATPAADEGRRPLRLDAEFVKVVCVDARVLVRKVHEHQRARAVQAASARHDLAIQRGKDWCTSHGFLSRRAHDHRAKAHGAIARQVLRVREDKLQRQQKCDHHDMYGRPTPVLAVLLAAVALPATGGAAGPRQPLARARLWRGGGRKF